MGHGTNYGNTDLGGRGWYEEVYNNIVREAGEGEINSKRFGEILLSLWERKVAAWRSAAEKDEGGNVNFESINEDPDLLEEAELLVKQKGKTAEEISEKFGEAVTSLRNSFFNDLNRQSGGPRPSLEPGNIPLHLRVERGFHSPDHRFLMNLEIQQKLREREEREKLNSENRN